MKKNIFCAIIITGMAAGAALAGSGTTGADFLNIPVGGRAAAFCGAYTAMRGDVFSAEYNPAGLAALDNRQLAVMHNEWMLGTRYEYLGCAMPLGRGAIAASIRYFDMGEFAGRNTFGQSTGGFFAVDQAFNIAYGVELTRMLSLGVSCMYITESIDGRTARGAAVDIGGDLSLADDTITIGVAAQNLGPSMSAFDQETLALPQSLVAGIAVRAHNGATTLTADMVMPAATDTYLAAGVEHAILGIFSLRAGLRFGSGREDAVAWAMGTGITLWGYTLDYCFEPIGAFEDTHRVSLLMSF